MDKIKNSLNIIVMLTQQDFISKYRNAYLGFGWIILTPVLQMIIIVSVFSYYFNQPNYPLYVLVGLLTWQYLSTTISLSTYSFTNHADLLHKTPFMFASIPLALCISSAINLVTGLMVLSVISTFWGIAINMVTSISALIGIVWVIWLTISLSILTSTIYVFFRDLGHAISSIMMIWFYATPVIWHPAILSPKLANLLSLNPLMTPLALLRQIAGETYNISLATTAGNLLITGVLSIIAAVIYRRLRPYFVDYT